MSSCRNRATPLRIQTRARLPLELKRIKPFEFDHQEKNNRSLLTFCHLKILDLVGKLFIKLTFIFFLIFTKIKYQNISCFNESYITLIARYLNIQFPFVINGIQL